MLDAGLVWFRRDLRADDHAALAAALAACRRVHCVFVYDRAILDELVAGNPADRRVDFIHRTVAELDKALRARGGGIIAVHDWAVDAIPLLAQALQVDAVFANRDVEPYARARDQQVEHRLTAEGRQFLTFKDQVVFERSEILTGAGRPYAVFTAYANAWRRRLAAPDIAEHATRGVPDQLAAPESQRLPTLAELGFLETDLSAVALTAGSSGARAALTDFLQRIEAYDQSRNYPALHGTSQLSVHLRFGTISIRELVRAAIDRQSAGARAWLNELIWREFYQMILWHHPHVEHRAYRPEFDAIAWEQGELAEQRFAAWCSGRTGYPLVDAAMRQLNAIGAMHNRLRMVTASFLTKHLGVDWRRGERYFARQLNDYDLAANNGGWQWSASTGCDAQPYFRIFNPVAQSEKFDAEGTYIRRWLPELAALNQREIHAPWRIDLGRQRAMGCVIGADYPAPIVDHAQARAAALERYSAASGK